ncbi:PH domain-containing protein [Nakamurella panacisegetis]|uniref:PH domain-containing protein n=1 Tax=Nakamurella panacisegetis TaxID=1090615 RepID=A0A1H0KQL6_9ACTN|nr:PH domain-containing protein [Nakamurella panacisegetis]SDO58258.1 PH domain-containing protein [Nakamurella panacisegetis]
MTGPTRTWGVRPLIPTIAGLLCLAFLIWVIVAGAPEDRLVAGAGAGVTAIAGALLLTMRRRLTAGPDGLVVRGPGGMRVFPWAGIVSIAAPSRRRRGLSSTSLEIELDDDLLLVFGRTELGGIDPADVVAALSRWWPAVR